jgi:hypothetical protein
MRTYRQAGGMTSDAILSRLSSSVIFLPDASIYENPRDFEPFRLHHLARLPLSMIARVFSVSNIGFFAAISRPPYPFLLVYRFIFHL